MPSPGSGILGIRDPDRCGGRRLHDLLVDPIAAATLGATLGALLLLGSRPAYALVDPDNRAFSYLVVIVGTVTRFAIAAAVLAAYSVWLRPGLVPLGAGLVAGFLFTVNFELFRYARAAGLPRKGGW